MRKTEEGLTKYVRGDGTEFHYTWTPTDKYHSCYGIFDYLVEHPNTHGQNRKGVTWPEKEDKYHTAYFEGEDIYSFEVPMTAMCHLNAFAYYESALKLVLSGVDLSLSSPKEMVKGTLTYGHFDPEKRLPATTLSFFASSMDFRESEGNDSSCDTYLTCLFPDYSTLSDTTKVSVVFVTKHLNFSDGFLLSSQAAVQGYASSTHNPGSKGDEAMARLVALAERSSQYRFCALACIDVLDKAGVFKNGDGIGGKTWMEEKACQGLLERNILGCKRSFDLRHYS